MKKIKTLLFIFRFYLFFVSVRLLTFFFKLYPYKANPKKDILYLEVFTRDGAGYNYRVQKWIDLMDGKSTHCFFLVENSKVFFEKIKPENLQRFLIDSMKMRIKHIIESRNYKNVVVRRRILLYNNYGNLFFEKLLRAAHPNIILDFDDDIAPIVDHKKSSFQKIMLDRPLAFNESFKFYNSFIVGSNYLKGLIITRYSKVIASNIHVIPTCVDYNKYEKKTYFSNPFEPVFKFGWIGGNHNLYLLNPVIEALNKISNKFNFELIIISGVNHYNFKSNFPINYIKYDLTTEINDLYKIDIGLMPLENDDISKGKCGFKLIQYMGLGIPGIASAITVNTEIVQDGINGWLVYSIEDWENVLQKALNNLNSLAVMGVNARNTIENNYSFISNIHNYQKIFN
jgi:glycosyltransferase involved in cell wall biosynthesis